MFVKGNKHGCEKFVGVCFGKNCEKSDARATEANYKILIKVYLGLKSMMSCSGITGLIQHSKPKSKDDVYLCKISVWFPYCRHSYYSI
jgi:hypothetical protein